MDSIDLELYQEEQRQILLDTKKEIADLVTLIEHLDKSYKAPSDKVEVSGEVKVNTEKEVAISNLEGVINGLLLLSDNLTKAIEQNAHKPLEAVTVKNIDKAKADKVKVTNLDELKKELEGLKKDFIATVEKLDLSVTVEKQDLPTDPKKPVAVRLSDGKQFYKAIDMVATAVQDSTVFTGANGNKAYGSIDAEGNLKVSKITGYISSDNSTTTLLTNGSTYTGTWEDVGEYNNVVVAVKTDQNGTYSIQFSPDGTNVDSTLTRYYKAGQINAPHRFTITRRYMRVTFTNNSGSDQTYLRLQTKVGEAEQLNVPLDGTVSRDYDATVVRPTSHVHEVALGLREGARLWNKWGYNSDVDTTTDPEVIAEFGGDYTPPTTATTLTIVSSDTADDGDPAGTGAQTLLIYGIDENREYQTEAVTMDGTTNVVTSNTWLGINRVAVTASGSNKSNVGKITITATTGGAILATVPAGEGVTQQLIYHMEANAQGCAEWLRLNADKSSGGGSPIVIFRGIVYSPITNTNYEVFKERLDTAVSGVLDIKPPYPFLLSPNDVFYVTAETSASNTAVSGRMSIIQYKNVGG